MMIFGPSVIEILWRDWGTAGIADRMDLLRIRRTEGNH